MCSHLKGLRLAQDVSARSSGRGHFELWVKRFRSDEQVNIMDSGFGIPQVLPILLQSTYVPIGGTLMVEQPEIHLHPRAQGDLGEFFIDFVANGERQAIIETHSENLVMRVQRLVAQGRKISHKDVMVYYIHPTRKGRRIVNLPIGPDGLFQEKWPRGFFEERLEDSRLIMKEGSRRK